MFVHSCVINTHFSPWIISFQTIFLRGPVRTGISSSKNPSIPSQTDQVLPSPPVIALRHIPVTTPLLLGCDHLWTFYLWRISSSRVALYLTHLCVCRARNTVIIYTFLMKGWMNKHQMDGHNHLMDYSLSEVDKNYRNTGKIFPPVRSEDNENTWLSSSCRKMNIMRRNSVR